MGNWTGKTVVVTGGCGFVGSHVVDELARRGCQHLLVYDDLSRGTLRNIEAHRQTGIIEHYVHDLAAVTPAFPPNVDAVFHLAALVSSISWNLHHSLDMLQVNTAINWHVTEAVRLAHPKVYAFTSTACIYPHTAVVPTPEEEGDACYPEISNWGYGCSKWQGEQQTKYLFLEEGIPSFSVRFFNAYGYRDYYDKATSHVAPALIQRVLDGENPLVIWGSGQQTRALVDARDLARALVDLAECPAAHDGEAVNIGHEQEISIHDLAEIIIRLSGKSDVAIVPDRSKPDGYPRRAADTTKLRSLIGWVPSTPLETTLQAMLADYRVRQQGER